MSLFSVSPEKEKALLERMESLGISEHDLKETFIRSSGPGGQKANKAFTCVQLTHIPTGITVKCQQSRSQSLNRFLARRLLLDRIERMQKGMLLAEQKEREKRKRQKRRRSRRAKEKILKEKHLLSRKKSMRSKVLPPVDEQ